MVDRSVTVGLGRMYSCKSECAAIDTSQVHWKMESCIGAGPAQLVQLPVEDEFVVRGDDDVGDIAGL